MTAAAPPALFTKANVTRRPWGCPRDSERDKLVNHIRGIDAYDINNNHNYTEQKPFKLGDIFHSNGVIVGEPSRYFEDKGYNGTGGFYQTYKNRRKVIIAGANDGMLHAFDAATGSEVWGFIPKAVLTDLRDMRYDHTFYVDASPKVADVWFYSSATDTTKSVSEWKTVLICGLRKGGNKLLCPRYHGHGKSEVPLGVPSIRRRPGQGGRELVRTRDRPGQNRGGRRALREMGCLCRRRVPAG